MRLVAILALLALSACMRAPAEQREAMNAETTYQRYAQLELDPAFKKELADAVPHQTELDWLAGEWDATVTVYATPSSPGQTGSARTLFIKNPDGQIVTTDFSTLLVYDPFQARWVTAGSEPPLSPMNVQTASAPWDGHKLVFEGVNHILGENFLLRQTMTKIDDNTFDLVNEQSTGNGYVKIDQYHYVRRVQPAG